MPITPPTIGQSNWGPTLIGDLNTLSTQVDANTANITALQNLAKIQSYTIAIGDSIPTGTITVLGNTAGGLNAWSLVGTNQGYISSITTAGLLTFAVAGTYLFIAAVSYGNSSNGRRMITLSKNGSEFVRMDSGSGGNSTVQVVGLATVAVSDTLSVAAFENSGSALNTVNPAPQLVMARIGF